MENVLNEFIKNEQLLNNYNLYESKEWDNFFKINLDMIYRPESQNYFRLPYYLIPINSDKIVYDFSQERFLKKNLFFLRNEQIFYPFFIHPSTKDLFCRWLNNKYQFISEENSNFIATPSSSFRSLFVKNTKTDEIFIVKLSIFDNVANGSRHIDWKSALGQFESCQMTKKAIIKKDIPLNLFEDIAAFSITGDIPVMLSNRFKIQFGSRVISTFGNIIRKIPRDFLFNSDKKYSSFASYTSIALSGNSLLAKGFVQSKLSFCDFIDKYITTPLLNIFFNLFENCGIMVEPHCQNTLLELDSNYIPTGKFYYRDFDMTSFDRARYPFLFTTEWIDYIKNRPDRITMYSNTSCRENIGIVFFNHFLDNLINPCLISGIKTGFISNQEAEKYYGIVFRKISDELKYLLPKINKQDYKKDYIGEKYCKISKKEIKGALESVDDFKNTSDFHKILLYRSNKNKKVDYYKINNDFILGFQNEILINMYLKY